MNRKFLNISLALFLACISTSAISAEWSTNIGFNSEYIYRGIPQKTSSAFAGVDGESGGFYFGTWGADVGDGIEIDYYGGYGWESGEFSFGIGGTIYTYTGDFDDTYKEVNLSVGYQWLTLDTAIGTYDNFGGEKIDYQFYSLTAEHNGFYGKIGMFSDGFSGDYYEAGYSNTLTINNADLFDYAFAAIYSNATLLGSASDTNLVLTLSKSFGL